jgi:homoserine/homoserine lactone efflux protein
VAVDVVLCLTPGPAVLCTIAEGLASGMPGALRAALGILVTNAAYLVVSAAGVATAFAASPQVFTALKWAGSGYLVFLGARALTGRVSPPSGGAGAMPDTRGSFVRGLIVQGANPKALVFSLAILPQFIDPRRGVAAQLAVLGLTSFVIELVILSGYGALAATAAPLSRHPRYAAVLQRASGALLVGAGLGLARI